MTQGGALKCSVHLVSGVNQDDASSCRYCTVTVTADELDPESSLSPLYFAVIGYSPAGTPPDPADNVATPPFSRAVPSEKLPQ